MVADRATAVLTDAAMGGVGTVGIRVKVCPSMVTIHSTGAAPVVAMFVVAKDVCCKVLLPLHLLLLAFCYAVCALSNVFPAIPPPGLMQKLVIWPSFWQLVSLLRLSAVLRLLRQCCPLGID